MSFDFSWSLALTNCDFQRRISVHEERAASMEHDMGVHEEPAPTPSHFDQSTAAVMEHDDGQSNSSTPFVVLGIDGGATSTSCVALDTSLLPSASQNTTTSAIISKETAIRAVIGRGKAGSSNRNSVGGKQNSHRVTVSVLLNSHYCRCLLVVTILLISKMM